MKIRIANENDIPEIVAVQKLAFYDIGVLHNNFRIGPLLDTIDFMSETFPKYTYIIVESDQRIIGSGRAKIIDNNCYIENIFVHPSHQKKGIGKTILLELESIFQDSEMFFLNTDKKNEKNIAFYQKYGYSVIEGKDIEMPDLTLVSMSKH